jgi:hypothetical protein
MRSKRVYNADEATEAMMETESARMSSAREARFRISDANSQPRAVKVIALDAPSEQVVKQLAQRQWNRASFFVASAFASTPSAGRFSVPGWLSDLAGRTKDLVNEIDSADLVVMIATAGQSAAAAAIIGETCHLKHVMTTALIIGSEHHSDDELSKTLAQLRPHALMLVIASAEEYVEDMLRALRA